MTTSPDDDDEPRRVRVYRCYDEFGMPGELIEVDAEHAALWDVTQWHPRPPR
jgi:hypothetical protein